jgi:hypothetical protein
MIYTILVLHQTSWNFFLVTVFSNLHPLRRPSFYLLQKKNILTYVLNKIKTTLGNKKNKNISFTIILILKIQYAIYMSNSVKSI